MEDKKTYELLHSVSMEEKKKITKGKSKKQLEEENITLDAAKNLLEKKVNDLEHENIALSKENEKMKQEICRLKNDVELERKTQRDDTLKQKQEFDMQIEKIIEDNRKKEKELLNERQEIWKYVQYVLENKSRFEVFISAPCENVQIGDSNTIQNNVMSQWQELTEKLFISMEDFKVIRQELEMEVSNIKIVVKEMQNVLKGIDKRKIKKHDRELLDSLLADRSDGCIFAEGIKELKNCSKTLKMKKFLPLHIDALVKRLLHKFDGTTCKDFVGILEGQRQASSMEKQTADREQTEVKETVSVNLDEFYIDTPLESSHCVEILSRWIDKSVENDFEKFIGKVKAYESKQAAEIIAKYEEEIRNRDVLSHMEARQSSGKGSGHERSAMESTRSRTEQSHPGLPDALSQFMHHLESLNIVLEIDRKVDKLLRYHHDNDKHDSPHVTSGV